jgi:DNA-nicking Smr family endonuclease
VEVDLHGYTVLTAERVARAVVQTAYARGYKAVRLITGHSTTRRFGDETIKTRLRAMLEAGDFHPWVYPFASGRHVHGVGFLTLALRPNRRARPETPWQPLPRPEFP